MLDQVRVKGRYTAGLRELAKVMNYPSHVLLIDALTSVPAMVLIIVAALFLGGFSFFAPWMVVTPPILLLAGLVRARTEGNTLLKGVVISLPSLIAGVVFGNYAMVGVSAPFLVLPCASGVWIRRRRHRLGSE
jgi:hypothetical protein